MHPEILEILKKPLAETLEAGGLGEASANELAKDLVNIQIRNLHAAGYKITISLEIQT